MRGYERDFERVVRALREGSASTPAERTLYDAAVTAAGGRPEGVQTKAARELEPGTRADVAAGMVLMPLATSPRRTSPGVLEDLDTEFLHDLRVSIRRARSVLRELAGVHPARASARGCATSSSGPRR